MEQYIPPDLLLRVRRSGVWTVGCQELHFKAFGRWWKWKCHIEFGRGIMESRTRRYVVLSARWFPRDAIRWWSSYLLRESLFNIHFPFPNSPSPTTRPHVLPQQASQELRIQKLRQSP